ncbi:dienelactone hydrolase family protein [Limnobacter parvus]|uniref:Dienelactone hydrolase family protein n=1 Tax=Limnobacter parvus TaxID=2939690 RepID=A0ABT1XKD3_9BURK|nr:dienelactone hydrolase family protein [Limnobacter parvus]MCR2747758.1 dienelactone hydrolase family protein [Limnobacter parvus]
MSNTKSDIKNKENQEHLEALTGGGKLPISRRTLLKGFTAGGFAVAASPILAQAITTSSEGLEEGRVFVDVGDDDMFAYRAYPKGKQNAPVILVVPEIFGVHAYIEDVCRRLAQAGFYALSPEIFFRHSEPGQYATVAAIIENVISKMDDAQVMADLDKCVEFASSEGANAQKLAVTGYCWGGRITWLYAAHQPAVKAGVAWYGRLVGAETELTPRHPVNIASELKAPVLGLYGSEDSSIPLDTVEQMRSALKSADGNPNAKASSITVFDKAQHGFHADYRPTYNSAVAKQAYNQALEFLRGKNLI